ncbi:serine/threonine-protein kinase [Thermocatellispora tengchongensis]|uniref:hypothetical protein n=1 Tax=Thermocatellispora tengchongensis TaxID=1073253 RepID=UPI003632DFC9
MRGLPVSASGDLFTWAATMVYAATGRSPFGEGSMTTVVNRLLHGAADLGPLDGPLRALAADCLAAEAGERPTAEEALLRLIGYSGLLDTALLSEPVPPADPPARRRRPRTPVLLAAALAVALVSAGVTYLLVPPSPARPAAAPASTASPPAVTARPPATPPPATPPPATTETGLPTGGTLYENPADPVKLASYHVGQDGKRTVAYARAGTSGDFRRVGGANAVAVVSHDGRRLAVVNELSFAQFQRQEVAFTDHRTGERFALPAATAPDVAQFLNWNRDNRRALLTVIGSLGQGPPVTRGFVILDVVARTSTFVPTTDAQDRPDPDAVPPVYYWTPDGNGVMAYYTTPELRNGVLFRDLTGRVTRTMHWVGNPVGRSGSPRPAGCSSPPAAGSTTCACGTPPPASAGRPCRATRAPTPSAGTTTGTSSGAAGRGRTPSACR